MNTAFGRSVPEKTPGSQSPASNSPNASLRAANERLWAQRAAHGQDKPSPSTRPSAAAEPASEGIWAHLPAHLGDG